MNYPFDKVCQNNQLERATVQAINQLFQLRGESAWPDGQVPDNAILAVSLYGLLKESGFKPETITASFTFFVDRLIKLGKDYAAADSKTPMPVQLWQICDNRYITLIEGPDKVRRTFDVIAGSEVMLKLSPVMILSVVLPKLYWLSVSALQEPAGPRDATVILPATSKDQPAGH